MSLRIGRFALVAAVAALLCQTGISLGSTVAWWRFEEGPADGKVLKGGQPNGVFYPGVADSSGNGNALSAWTEDDWAGEAYRTDVGNSVIPQTGAANNFSVQNTGDYPGMFTDSAAMRTWQPSAFTIEVSFKPRTGDYRTLVGRDSRGTATINGDLAALYLQIIPGDAVAIKFCDVSGFWHEAVSDPGAVQGFQSPDTGAGHWYNMAAISDGKLLSLYLDSGAGYQLVRQTDLTLSGSPDTTLTAGLGSGGDWLAGNWSVGRGLYGGGHGDRAYGFIDEVRISDAALPVSALLMVPEPASMSLVLMGLSLMALRRRRN